jgi:hypothetical protein
MRRIGRWMIDGLTVLSLVLCVATAGFWVRSYSVLEAVEFRKPFSGILGWSRGEIAVGLTVHGVPRAGFQYTATRATFSLAEKARGEFGSNRSEVGGIIWGREPRGNKWIVLPCWIIATITAITPALWLGRAVRQRLRVRPGFCSCGYNLTANVSGVCPECGMAVANR